MDRSSRIYVAGHRGLAGSAIVRALRAAGYENLVLRSSGELDLTEQAGVRALFDAERPDYVIDAAAKVGGIVANSSLPAEFIRVNLTIQTNLIHEAWRAGVKRLLFLGSNCIYPRDCPQPIKEDYLLTGPLEPTNRPYALAKIAGLETCWAYNRQYGTRFAAPMPTNMYGPNDSYDPEHAHVISSFIRKFYEAKKTGAQTIVAWGTGSPRREFLHSDDMAAACLHLLDLSDADWDRLFPLERTSVTGLTHVVGTVSMPRGDQADSARSGFVIHLNDQPSLNLGGMRFDDGQGTAAFGRVVAGMDVVRTIQQQPVKGQSLAPPVEIKKAFRLRPAAPPQDQPIVVFETEKGTIEIAIDAVHAPITAANFLKYVDGRFYDGGVVNRAAESFVFEMIGH